MMPRLSMPAMMRLPCAKNPALSFRSVRGSVMYNNSRDLVRRGFLGEKMPENVTL